MSGKGLSIKYKILIAGFASVLVSIVIISVISYISGRGSLLNAAIEQMDSLKHLKKITINEYFKSKKNDTIVLSEAEHVEMLVRELISYHNANNIASGADYPVNAATQNIAKKYDRYFEHYAEEEGYGYYDIFVLCAKHGHVMYTYARESDLGANLSSGPLKESGLGQLWAKVTSTGNYSVIDMEPYAPSGNEPAMFVGTPVMIDGEMQAVLAMQLNDRQINSLMQLRVGLGNTGESYLVGSDLLMRSDSYLDPEHRSLRASFASPATGRVDTEAVQRGFEDLDETEFSRNYLGDRVLTSYERVEIEDVHWVMVSEIGYSEIIAPAMLLVLIIVISAVILLAAAAVLLWFSSAGIVKPLVKTTEVLKDLSEGEGDLTARLEVATKDEVGELATNFNTFIQKIMDVIIRVKESTNDLLQSAEEVLTSGTALSQISSEQAASAEEISATLEELSSRIEQSASNAGDTNKIAKEASDMAKKGGKGVSETVDAMNNISARISAITEISTKTNMLALNAAIEAARAGDAGKGFAVVAGEVRKLAERSQIVAEEVVDLAESSVVVANSAGTQIQSILPIVDQTAVLVDDISASSEEQSSGVNQIRSGMDQLNDGTQQNAASAEELAASAKTLKELSEGLQELMNSFKTE